LGLGAALADQILDEAMKVGNILIEAPFCKDAEEVADGTAHLSCKGFIQNLICNLLGAKNKDCV
jgi:hypothetical protein